MRVARFGEQLAEQRLGVGIARLEQEAVRPLPLHAAIGGAVAREEGDVLGQVGEIAAAPSLDRPRLEAQLADDLGIHGAQRLVVAPGDAGEAFAQQRAEPFVAHGMPRGACPTPPQTRHAATTTRAPACSGLPTRARWA